jgi:hypothetical protein
MEKQDAGGFIQIGMATKDPEAYMFASLAM